MKEEGREREEKREKEGEEEGEGARDSKKSRVECYNALTTKKLVYVLMQAAAQLLQQANLTRNAYTHYY